MIFVILPAFNEEASLPKLIPKIEAAFLEKKMPFHLIVVDDGSRDRTGLIINDFMKDSNFPIDIITHKINRGLGESERDGFEKAAEISQPGDIIVRVEGDDTHDPKYIFNLIDKLNEGFDVVNTSRFAPGGDQLGLNANRKLLSRLANLFMSVIFGIKGVRDYSCGFRAYRAEVIKDAVSIFGNSLIQLKGLGFTSTLEILVKLNILGCRFSEVPFVLRYDLKESESKMISSITTLGYLSMALLYHWPWGGWKSQFKGLNKLYLKDASQAVEEYNIWNIRRRTVSRIGG
jgi:dolichol-phosphate mannosyltransferase